LSESRWRRSSIISERKPYGFDACVSRNFEGTTRRFGIGLLVAVVVFGIALGVSDDLRLLYVSGALLFALAAFLLGAPAREDLIAAALLLFASMFLFAFFVLPQTPLLWPTLVLWVAIVVWLLFRKRFAAILTMAAATILIAVSAWYCAHLV
jgi:hypothetical protein